MKKKLTGLALLMLSAFQIFAQNADPLFTRTSNGITVLTAGNTKAVRLEAINESIIRVTASADKQFATTESLIVIPQSPHQVAFTVAEAPNAVSLKTKKLTATVQTETGIVSFFDAGGKPLLAEAAKGRSFKPTMHEGQPFYEVRQTWQTTPTDDWYGLGQHQEGALNYRSRQVFFFQNNTEVAVPFLISPHHYGILWDNYSLTTASDIRPFKSLESMQLTDVHGEKGWLTASYFNEESGAAKPVAVKAESSIDIPFEGMLQKKIPAGFKPATGTVVWEGKIGTALQGEHQLHFTFGGSLKIWINGQLAINRWRKAWNPAPVFLPLNLSGQPVSIKIEWMPEGDESYISATWREPQPQGEKDQFSFSSEAARQVDYYFVTGQNMDEVISGYRTLTGKAHIVPKWALGFWQSRERYKTQQELIDIVAEYRRRQIPLDNIVQDWSYWKEDDWGSQDFDLSRFPNFDSAVNVLHMKYNSRIMISVWPKFYEGIPEYKKFDAKGWLYKRNIADRQRDWIAQGYTGTFYDAFNADARKYFWDLINKKIYTKGIDAWWMDASEPDVLSNVSPAKRKLQMAGVVNGPAAAWLNAYPLQNAKGIYEGQRGTDPNQRVFLLTRSGFAGSQRYAAAIWSGDIGATWHDMKMQIAAGVNFSMSGIPYWTMDIGGFVVERRFEEPTPAATEEWREMQTRWFQFGSMVPLYRAHGQWPYREIFNIAPETHDAYKSMLYYTQLRYRLMPYIYSLAGHTYHHDYTIMRGLVMDFPADAAARGVADQFMLGPSLMACPVTEYKVSSRKTYLPAGSGWYNLYSGQYHEGGKTIEAEAPYQRMPMFVKAGSILPVGPAIQYTDEKKTDPITLYVFKGANGSFELYEDGGLTYDYEKGGFSTIPFTYNDQTGMLTIGKRTGSYTGMQASRTFNIVVVSTQKAIAFDPATNKGISKKYNGQAISIQL